MRACQTSSCATCASSPSTHPAPGSLLSILQEFAARAINLSKLESRPTKSRLGDYCFIIDLEGHVDDELDLHRGVQGQRAHAHGTAGVETGLPEDLPEQVGGAVDDAGLAGEGRVAGDIADDLDHLDDGVEVPDLRGDRRQRVERSGTSQLGRPLRAHVVGPVAHDAGDR